MWARAIIAYRPGKVTPWYTSFSWSEAVASTLVTSAPSVIFSTPAAITRSLVPEATSMYAILSATPPEAHADSTRVGRDALHSERVRHQGADMLLADELSGRHVPHVYGIDPIRARAAQRLGRGLDEQVAQAPLPQLAEPRHPRGDDRHFTHNSSSDVSR